MPASDQTSSGAGSRQIVIVVGPGRSGTSTVAGALAKSGFEVPGRAIQGNATNPSGFFEPRWVVDFHRELLDLARVATMDPSPEAIDVAAEVGASAEVRSRLADWLGERLEEQPRLVVKDPRTIWFKDLWVSTARDLGIEPGFVTMLRHPAEVSASRQKYYAKGERENSREDDIRRIAGWTNVALLAEQVTQGSPRAFVKYADLVTDWRGVLDRLGTNLRLTFDPPTDVTPHPVDDFIDPSLYRVHVDWDDVDIPAALQEVAEETWTVLSRLADEGDSTELASAVSALRDGYRQMNDDALALNRQTIRRLEAAARRQGRRQLRKELSAHGGPAGARRSGVPALWRRLTRNAR